MYLQGNFEKKNVSCISQIFFVLGCSFFFAFALHETLAHNASLVVRPYIHQSEIDSCPRYAYVKITTRIAGLGHRFSDLVFGYIFARENNSTFILEGRDVFGLDTSPKGFPVRKYPWFADFFGLSSMLTIDDVLQTHPGIVRKYVDVWEHAPKYSHACGVIIETCDLCCTDIRKRAFNETNWCFVSKFGAYNQAKPFFNAKFHNLIQYHPKIDAFNVSKAANEITIAWHIRIGDIVLTQASNYAFVKKVFDQLHIILSNIKYRLFIFSDGNLDWRFRHFGQYNPVYVNYMDEKDGMYHLAHADILVTSGSSFAAVAALLAKDGSIVLQARPKEQILGVYDLYDQGFLDDDGVILKPPLSVLALKAQELAIKANKTP